MKKAQPNDSEWAVAEVTELCKLLAYSNKYGYEIKVNSTSVMEKFKLHINYDNDGVIIMQYSKRIIERTFEDIVLDEKGDLFSLIRERVNLIPDVKIDRYHIHQYVVERGDRAFPETIVELSRPRPIRGYKGDWCKYKDVKKLFEEKAE